MKRAPLLFAFLIGLVVGASGLYAVLPKNKPQEPVAVKCEPQPEPVAEVQPPQILGAPKFREEGPIKSNIYGEILLKWEEVPNAKKFQVRIYDPKGKEIQGLKTPRTFAYIKDLSIDPGLPFTPYFAAVAILDEEGNPGPQSEKIELRMIPLRNLHAPKIKAIVPEN